MEKDRKGAGEGWHPLMQGLWFPCSCAAHLGCRGRGGEASVTSTGGSSSPGTEVARQVPLPLESWPSAALVGEGDL